jgi:hypothetical protein
MKFEEAAELAGTAVARLVDPLPNRWVNLFSCECGRIESDEQEVRPRTRQGASAEAEPTNSSLG